MKVLLYCCIISVCSLQSISQGLKVKGKLIVDKEGNPVLLRGMGLGGWMLQEPYMMQLSGIAATQQEIKNKIIDLVGIKNTETFYNEWLLNHCTKTDIDSLASWGFNSVRLPMHYNLYTLPIEKEPARGKNTWLRKGFALTDSLLKWCKANKMYLILDLHAAPGGQGNDVAIADRDSTKPSLWQNELNQQKTIALWEQLAKRYVNEEWIGGYDIINEPNYGFENSNDKNGCAEKLNVPLRKFYVDATAAIRKIDKKHIIFIEGNCWGNNYGGIFPLWDDQLVVSFHKYWNYTNQGSIQNFLDLREKYNVPIWMGETGENSNVWFTNAIELFEKNNIGWTMWPLKKAGINNPLQVIPNEGFKNILSYWRGTLPKPSPGAALKGLMQLTKDINIKNNGYQKDVIDAMFRQVNSTSTIPYKHHSTESIKPIFAVDYNMGRSSIAYHDKDSANYWVSNTIRTAWNQGRLYRNDGVDIEACSDSITNGFNIGWIQEGEWLQYTINSKGGIFDLDIRYSSKDSSGLLQLMINNETEVEVELFYTNSNQKWVTKTIKNIKLAKGINQIKLVAKSGGNNLNYFHFTSNKNR